MAADAAYEKAVKLLARRPHFERELVLKLRRRGFEEGSCAEVVVRLRREGFLDDHACAVDFLTSRLRRKPQGRRRLRAELERRGVRGEAIEAALAAVVPEDERELAREAARRWRARGGGSPQALQRHLDRLGFSARDILAVAADSPSSMGV